MVADSSSELRVARIIHGTTAEGPGLRTAVWVQGCSIRCTGCINPHLFTTRGGELMDVARIVAGAIEAGDEGITLLGGEPLDQGWAASELAREAQLAGLGVICFTGYTLETVESTSFGQRLLEHVDLLVDGPYVASTPDADRALVGSTNQRFIHITNRYADYEPRVALDRLDLRILPSGEVSVAGFATSAGVGALAAALSARRGKRTTTASPSPSI